MVGVSDTISEMGSLFKERGEVYGNNYKQFGFVCRFLFPDGKVELSTPQDHNRFGILVQIISKLTRYAQNFNKGGHRDSLIDLSLYCHMLMELESLDVSQNIKDDDFLFDDENLNNFKKLSEIVNESRGIEA